MSFSSLTLVGVESYRLVSRYVSMFSYHCKFGQHKMNEIDMRLDGIVVPKSNNPDIRIDILEEWVKMFDRIKIW